MSAAAPRPSAAFLLLDAWWRAANYHCEARLAEHHVYIRDHGDDMPDVRD